MKAERYRGHHDHETEFKLLLSGADTNYRNHLVRTHCSNPAREWRLLMIMDHGRADKSLKDVATRRYLNACILWGGSLVCGLIILTNLNPMVKLGLPLVFLVFMTVRIGWQYLEQRSRRLIQRAKNAARGALAERDAARCLEDLPEEYHGFYDLDFEGFNRDHAVVVGPGGVFLIEIKSCVGRISSVGGRLLLNGNTPEKDFLNGIWTPTGDLGRFLYNQTSKEWKVRPVLCFTKAFVGVSKPVQGITITPGASFTEFLLEQPRVMNREEVKRIAGIFSSHMSWYERAGLAC